MTEEEVKAPEPRWIQLQKKIFGRYAAQQLRKAGVNKNVNDIVEDLKDGVLLIDIVESLSGQQFGNKPKAAKMRIQQIDNVNEALNFVKKVGIKSTTSAEDIVDGNSKHVLGLIFAIILKYMKLDEDDATSSDPKEALLLWFKNKTAGYANVSIESFTKSFQDGLAFAALIHKMRPRVLNFSSLTPDDKIGNLTLTLNTAAKYCNVEKYLEPSEIAELDEIGMVVYLYDWYYGVSLLQKQDIAARRIGKLADMTKLHDQMRADYNSQAASLVSWVDGKIADLNNRDIDNTMSGIRSRLDKFYNYKSKEKGERIVAHLDLNSLFDNLALRLRNNKRPEFQPAQPPSFVDERFDALEKAEAEASLFLHTELERQIRLDNLGKRFRAEVQVIEDWIKEKLNYCNKTESIDSVDIAKYHIASHSQVEAEFESMKKTRVASLHKLLEELVGEKYEFSTELNGLARSVDAKYTSLEAAGASKKAALEAELDRQKKINDDLLKAFAAAVKNFVEWTTAKKNSVNDKSASLEHLLSFVEKTLSDTADVTAALHKVDEANTKVQERQITLNPYTNLTAEDCKAQWTQFQLLLQKKKELLVAEIENSKRAGLSEEQVREVNDNFDYFDKDKSGALERREIRSCLQSLGEDATPVDVTNLLKAYDKTGAGVITKAGFTEFMIKKLGDTNTQEEILDGWKLISFEKAFVPAEQLNAMVNDLTFKDHHVEYLSKELQKTAEGYDYVSWTAAVFAR